MLEGRKYVINDNAGITMGLAQVPDTLLCPGDDYIQTGGLAIGMGVTLADVETPVVLCLTDEDARNLIIAIKKTRKNFKRKGGRRH